jgi:hypothetical protein
MRVRDWFSFALAHTKWLGVTALLSTMAFVMASAAQTGLQIAPTLGFLLWGALSWYVADRADSFGEQVLGVVSLIAAIIIGFVGCVSVLLELGAAVKS